MRRKVLITTGVLFSLLHIIYTAHADNNESKIIAYEQNIALERKTFEWFEPKEDKLSVADPEGDNVGFQNNTLAKSTPFLVDLKSLELKRENDSWLVTFETWNEIPEDPGMPVNFHVYFDVDQRPENNAPNGVFRAGIDTGFMLLFGTRTKWHSMFWQYNSTTKKWDRNDKKPAFKIESKRFHINVPFEIVPKEKLPKVRGLSLVSNNAGLTIIDLIPGKGIPEVAGEQVP